MRGFVPTFKREVLSWFVTPMAWALLVIFLLLQGLNFYLLIVHFANQVDVSPDRGPIQWFFGDTILFYLPLLMLPAALTMRSFAEERRTGTIEMLLTAPVSTPGIVLAKWSSALVAYLVTWAPTGLYLAILRKAGPIDWNVVGTSYLGVTLIGSSLLALGVLASSVSRNQFVALVIALAASIGLFVIGIGAFVFDQGIVHDVCRYVSIWAQMGSFSKGIIDSRAVVFHLSITAWALFTAGRVVDSWRWG